MDLVRQQDIVVSEFNTDQIKVGNLLAPLEIYCTGAGLSPCETCNNNPKNGEARVCCCQLGLPKITC